MTGPRLLVVDDDAVDREAIRRLLGRDYEVLEAASAQEGLALARARRPECVLVDYRLPDGSGVDLLQRLSAEGLPVVMLSGMGSESVAVAALKSGAADYLSKDGLTADALRVAVRGALGAAELGRRLAEKQAALEHRTEQLRVLLEQLPAVVWTVDRTLTITSCAGRQLDRLGLERTEGTRIEERPELALGTPELIEQHRHALAGVSTRHAFERGGRTYEAHLEPLRDATADVTGAIGIVQDTSERRRLEDQLRHSQKMEALGRLAGGVAHDFNNMLTVIVNCASLAADTLPDDHVARQDLDEVLAAGQRAAELTRQLLAFSRRRAAQPVVVDVAVQLRDTGRMLVRLLAEDVQLKIAVAPGVGSVRIDPGALEQVLVNLAVNARDAMPAGGRLLIDASPIDIERGWLDFRGVETPPGSYVRIVVNDTGVGMSAEVRARLFEPFFTTKATGKGTGLGLATVYGIVTQAGGVLHVYSEVGAGTAFHVYLPRLGEEASAALPPPTVAEHGTETVLVVEDDPKIRLIAGRVLTEYGYRPLVAPTGEDALQMLASGLPVDVMVTDVVMPGIPGDRLIQRALELRPNLRAVLMSGYSPQFLPNAALQVPVLQKPFTPSELVRAVRQALE